MQNNKTVIAIIVLVLILGAAFFIIPNITSDPMPPEDTTETNQVANSDSVDSDAQDDESMDEETIMAPEGSYVYEQGENVEASYTVEKTFFDKPLQFVTGTTNQVDFMGWFNPTDGSLVVAGVVGLNSLDSGSQGRDDEVQGLWTDANATFKLDLQEGSDIVLDQEFSGKYDVMVTINGNESTIPFEVTGLVTEDSFQATGTGTTNMTDAFSVEPFSAAAVYEVQPDFTLGFDIEGNRVNTDMQDDETDDETDDAMSDEEMPDQE